MKKRAADYREIYLKSTQERRDILREKLKEIIQRYPGLDKSGYKKQYFNLVDEYIVINPQMKREKRAFMMEQMFQEDLKMVMDSVQTLDEGEGQDTQDVSITLTEGQIEELKAWAMKQATDYYSIVSKNRKGFINQLMSYVYRSFNKMPSDDIRREVEKIVNEVLSETQDPNAVQLYGALVLNKLVKIANDLDKLRYHADAAEVDSMVQKLAYDFERGLNKHTAKIIAYDEEIPLVTFIMMGPEMQGKPREMHIDKDEFILDMEKNNVTVIDESKNEQVDYQRLKTPDRYDHTKRQSKLTYRPGT